MQPKTFSSLVAICQYDDVSNQYSLPLNLGDSVLIYEETDGAGKCVINYFDFAHIYRAVRVMEYVFFRTDYHFALIHTSYI